QRGVLKCELRGAREEERWDLLNSQLSGSLSDRNFPAQSTRAISSASHGGEAGWQDSREGFESGAIESAAARRDAAR
uniref:Ig-like domain-containing protein n=1 Tax=Macrostomum lignano TaxID=282301 RepID=A0A1I8FRD0_9PLAT